MNIWIINHYALTPYESGGTRHYEIAKRLNERKIKVTIIRANFHHLSGCKPLKVLNGKYVNEKYKKINFIRLKTRNYNANNIKRVLNIFDFLYNLLIYYKEFQPLPHLIIGSTVHPFAALAGYIISLNLKIPFIYEIRDLWPDTLISIKSIKKHDPINSILIIIDKILLKKSFRIITLLPNSEKRLIQNGAEKSSIKYIPNGISVQKNCKNKKNTKKSKIFKFMYLGSHGRANNLETILYAAKILKESNTNNIKIYLIGDGPEKKKLIEMAKELKISQMIIFNNPVKKKNIYKTMRKADALIFHLRKLDVFKHGISSNKLWEYMASKRPILFACNSSNDPIRESNCGISINPEDSKSMAKNMLKLSKYRNKRREKLGENGYNYVINNHDYDKISEEFERLITNTLFIKNGNKKR